MHGPSDTSPDVELRQMELLRSMSPTERVNLAFRLSTEVIQASKRAIARLHPEFSPRQVEHAFVELHYGKELADGLRAHDEKLSDGQR